MIFRTKMGFRTFRIAFSGDTAELRVRLYNDVGSNNSDPCLMAQMFQKKCFGEDWTKGLAEVSNTPTVRSDI
jgi:hypothetical protein